MTKTPEPSFSPLCSTPDCHRRADVYRRNADGTRTFRTLCRACRSHRTPTPRPRPYQGHLAPSAPSWPENEKCPWCHRRREPRTSQERRRSCKIHRGRWMQEHRPELAKSEKRLGKKKKIPHVNPIVKKKAPPVPAASVPVTNPRVVSFRDMGRVFSILIPRQDYRRLWRLFKKDVGIYPASTHTSLSRRYPTGAITVLFARWAKEHS